MAAWYYELREPLYSTCIYMTMHVYHWFSSVLTIMYARAGPVDASKTVFVNQTAVIVVTKGVYSGMGMIPKDCFGNVAIIDDHLLSIEIHKVREGGGTVQCSLENWTISF